MRLDYAPRVLRDIEEILAYIHDRSPRGASSVSVAIEYACERCARHPYTGSRTDEPAVLRYPLTKYRYTIFYRVDVARDVVEIAHVTHGARVESLHRLPDEQ